MPAGIGHEIPTHIGNGADHLPEDSHLTVFSPISFHPLLHMK